MQQDLTNGPILKSMIRFALPMIAGNLLQQAYNIADTLIVGRILGLQALAAVGSAFSLMTFLTSIMIGLCMGSGALFSIYFGSKDQKHLEQAVHTSFVVILMITVLINVLSFAFLDWIPVMLNVPDEVWSWMRIYLQVVFCGIPAVFLYNFFAAYLRSAGNSVTPLILLAISAILNIVLDLAFILVWNMGIFGAAAATVFAQYVSGIGLMGYCLHQQPDLWFDSGWLINRRMMSEVLSFSVLTSLQQSVMNLGILMVQGLVNSFGAVVMAAFAAAVKIDAFAYMPVQDFGNAFSTFAAQNYGAGKPERIQRGFRLALECTVLFSILISILVVFFAPGLMKLFVDPTQTEVIACGVRYLRIEGSFYFGIGILFLWYGFYRAVGKPGMSVVLTIVSLGTRVILAYLLSSIPAIGVTGIWWSVVIGWGLADGVGLIVYLLKYSQLDQKDKSRTC